MWTWFSRCVPVFSLFLLITLLLLAFPDVPERLSHLAPWSRNVPPSHHNNDPRHPTPLSLAQKLFIGYVIALHCNAVGFTARLAWALSRMVVETRAVLRRRPASKSFGSPIASDSPPFADSPIIYPSPAPTPEPTTFELGLLEEGEGGEVIHAIILPNYSEDLDTLQTTLNVLASHPRASTQYEVRQKSDVFIAC